MNSLPIRGESKQIFQSKQVVKNLVLKNERAPEQ